MSLYEKYFSKINEEHMFQLIKKIILEDTGINIDTNEIFKNIFKERYPIIFEENNVDTLIDLNKLLIDDICGKIVIEMKDKNNPKKEIVNIPLKKEIEPIVSIKEEELLLIKSIKRKKQSLNRFNYQIDCDECNLKINKIVIPYEDNEIFINDLLLIRLNKIDIYCQLKEKNKIKQREYLTYIPYQKREIKLNDVIHIQIMNELEKEIIKKDIYLVDFSKNIVINDEEYLCINLLEDIEIEDKLGLIKDDEIKEVVKVIFKTKEYLLCEKKDIVFDSIINLSLQNTIYCEIS